MKCNRCEGSTKVVDTRYRNGMVIRRRECTACKHRYSTKEIEVRVIKEIKKAKEFLENIKTENW